MQCSRFMRTRLSRHSSTATLPVSSSVTVVSGASRGIGLEFVSQYLQSDNSAEVVALSRSKSSALVELEKKYPHRLQHICCDLERDESITAAGIAIKEVLNGKPVTTLLNVAAILGTNTPTEPGPERSMRMLEGDWMRRSFQINSIGPALLTQQIIPLLKKPSGAANKDLAPGSRIVNISARVGSISDNKLGGWYSYRMSKAALNMFTKTLSIEVFKQGCAVISLHPGTTDTGLSKHFTKNKQYEVVAGTKEQPVSNSVTSGSSAGKLFTTEYSVSCMRQVIQQLQMADSGKCFAYDGTVIPY